MTTLLSTYKKLIGTFSSDSDSVAIEPAPKPKNSLMHLIYLRKVSSGLIPAGETCDNCICFGDEWPL